MITKVNNCLLATVSTLILKKIERKNKTVCAKNVSEDLQAFVKICRI